MQPLGYGGYIIREYLVALCLALPNCSNFATTHKNLCVQL